MSLYPQWNELVKLFPDGAFADKYLLGKSGSTKDNVALVASIADEPAYVVMDSTLYGAGLFNTGGSTNLTQALACKRLGLGGKLAWAHSANAIADGDDVVSNGDGQIASLQTLVNGGAHGTYWKVGICCNDSCVGGALGSSDGVEFLDIPPVQVTI